MISGTPFDDAINGAAGASGIDAALVAAICSVESGFNPNAVNNTGGDALRGGAWGLMQVTLKTAQGYGYTGDGPGLQDVATNLQYGCSILADALSQSNGDVAGAASAYNSGSIANAAGSYATKVVALYNQYAANETSGPDTSTVAIALTIGFIGFGIWYATR
jgi:soluble lytic murein transglycosylase-like protein